MCPVAFVALLATTGCVHAPINQRLNAYDEKSGYRISNTPAVSGNTDDVFVILAFSGGGTRASAFSYGAMEKLGETLIRWGGRERPLLDEVDIISSVSGGSFTAAYYGLHRGEEEFAKFPENFLYKRVTRALAWRLLNPYNWWRLASPNFDRIDMAAEYYDNHVFGHKTFGDLAAKNARPFIVLNATDMSYSSRFEFTQDQFDFLSSDLSSYPVARGVAASSAFPILLSPLTLANYPGFPEQEWMRTALKDRDNNPRDHAYASVMRSYLDTAQRPFIHLLDGGLSDNVGLRGPAYALFSSKNAWSKKTWTMTNLINARKIKYLVVITVNAKTSGAPAWDQKRSAPGVSGVLSTVTTGPMGNYSDETVQFVRDQLEALRQDLDNGDEIDRLGGRPVTPRREIKVYPIELAFQNANDAGERSKLNQIATDFQIPKEDVDRLRAAARTMLDESTVFKKLLEDLAADQSTPLGSDGKD